MSNAVGLSILLMALFYAHAPLRGRDKEEGPKEATVLIIRHGEKPAAENLSEGLSKAGAKRADDYVRYFTGKTISGISIRPDCLFSADRSKASNRSFLTIKPLGENLRERIDHRFANDDTGSLVKELRTKQYKGKTILIAWHHGEIPKMLKHFGANSDKLLGKHGWPEDVFGWLVILRFDKDGALAASSVVNEHLEANDTLDPPNSLLK